MSKFLAQLVPIDPNQAAPISRGLNRANEVAGLASKSATAVTANIVNVTLSMIGILFLVMLVFAGGLYLTAAGDTKRVERAKKLVAAAVIGLVLVVSAFAISTFVFSQLDSALNGGPGAPEIPADFPAENQFPDEVPV